MLLTEKGKVYQNVNVHELGQNSKKVSILCDKTGQFSIVKDGKLKGVDGSHLHIIPALVDLKSYLGEPGDDLAETIEVASKNALASGFDQVAVHSNKNRLLKNKEDIHFVLNESKKYKMTFLPVGSIITQSDNEQMTALFEMKEAGAIAFANPNNESLGAGFTQRVQQYMSTFNGLLMTHALEGSLKQFAAVAETSSNTQLGFNGSPAIAEQINIERDIAIAAYNCAPLHISGISTKQGVTAIKAAKKQGVAITCDVSIFSLCFTDEDLRTFDTNLKLFPYLRSKKDQAALFDGLKDGTIDAIASYHQPKVIESKACEFDYADFGAISWQTFIPMALQKVITKTGWDMFIEKTSNNPAKILNIQNSENYIVVDELQEWDYNETSNLSLSSNSPWFNKKLKGAVIGKIKL